MIIFKKRWKKWEKKRKNTFQELYERFVEGDYNDIDMDNEGRDYNQNKVDAAFANWATRDEQEVGELESFFENEEGYLSDFPSGIRDKYGRLCYMWAQDGYSDYFDIEHKRASIDVPSKIEELLLPYITDPKLAEQDFDEWINQVILGPDSGPDSVMG